MFCSPRPACASSFVCAAWSVPCAACVCLLVARSCCHCAACRVAPSPVLLLWCGLPCSVLVLCAVFALVLLVALFVVSTSVPGLCIFLVCLSSLLVYITSWSVYLPAFLVCISSLRLHLFLVCISSWSVSRRCVFVSLSVWSICVFASKNVCPAGELVVLERRSSVYLSDLYLVIAS